MNGELWRIIKAFAGCIVSFFLGLHTVIQLLIYAIAFDILTGLLCASIDRTIASDISRRGMARKALVIVAVAAAEVAGRRAGLEITVPWGGAWGLGAAVAGYYCVQEAISITENLARAGVPLPRWITDRLRALGELDDGGGR